MDIIKLHAAIQSGLDGFKQYLQRKTHEQSDFLERFFWIADASQMNVLNYLIHLCQASNEGQASDAKSELLLSMIEYVVSSMRDKNIGLPVHQAINEGKIKLALHLITLGSHAETEQCIFNLNLRDLAGRTLLFLALAKKNADLLTLLLKKKTNVHLSTSMGGARISVPPIHLAVINNYPHGIHYLAQYGADLGNQCGTSQDTPVLLAAHLQKIDALEALLEHPIEALRLEAVRVADSKGGLSKYTAIERLCEHLEQEKNKAEVLRGIAMLLCRGAEPPRNEPMRHLLSYHRSDLLKAVHHYLEDKPELVDAFVARCHLTESALHNIVYAHHSWGHAIRLLFGKPSEVGFIVENLIVRKYATGTDKSPATLPMAAAEHIALDTDPLKLYALFVKRYIEAYDNQLITNSWSTMRWMIADGQCDWAKVVRYVQTNPKSRSAIIYNELFRPMPQVSEEMDDLSTSRSLTPA